MFSVNNDELAQHRVNVLDPKKFQVQTWDIILHLKSDKHSCICLILISDQMLFKKKRHPQYHMDKLLLPRKLGRVILSNYLDHRGENVRHLPMICGVIPQNIQRNCKKDSRPQFSF